MNEATLKQSVAESGRRLLADGLAARTWGNVSGRIGGQEMAITPSGLGYEGMTAGDIVSVDIWTGAWDGTRPPSSEAQIHQAAYRIFSDCAFVMHTHQTYASAVGLTGFSPGALTEAEEYALGGVALADYGLPGTEILAGHVADAFRGGAHTVLMARHGAVIAAGDREEAFRRARLLETVCRRACLGQPADTPVFDEALARRLTDAAAGAFGHGAYTAAAPVLACAAAGADVPAQLDDMAQMIGPRMPVVSPCASQVLAALRQADAVLVPGAGAVCRAAAPGDLNALCMLAEKACICRLHTETAGVGGRLSPSDARFMRANYLEKYAGMIKG